jgi:hypothetical protein
MVNQQVGALSTLPGWVPAHWFPANWLPANWVPNWIPTGWSRPDLRL